VPAPSHGVRLRCAFRVIRFPFLDSTNSLSFPFFPLLYALTPCGPNLFLFLFSSYQFSFFIPTQANRKGRLEQALHFPFLLSLPLTATRHSFLTPYSPRLTHASSNTSPLAFPRFRLVHSRRFDLRSTSTSTSTSNAQQLLLDGDTLPSPGERNFVHWTSGHSDSADD
jgi:hypothetical protein